MVKQLIVKSANADHSAMKPVGKDPDVGWADENDITRWCFIPMKKKEDHPAIESTHLSWTKKSISVVFWERGISFDPTLK